ncbi:MAG: GDP-mannose 4,6-dehydratase, partial [Chlamydiia bacterium]|nr:GDP-mannose 4,6-dehydratase [Chlamydiia bacterium]
MRTPKRVLVTGGAGFIGSAFIHFLLKRKEIERVINFDLLTYAGTLKNIEGCEKDVRYRFIHGDICDQLLVEKILKEEKIDTLVHFAAESHVDRSIASARPFVEVNVLGT